MDARRKGWLLAGGGMLLMSLDSLFIRIADIDSWTIAFLFGIGSTITFTALATTGRDEPVRRIAARAPVPMVVVAVLAAASVLSFTAAVNHTAVANVVVIVASTPIFAAVFAWLLLHEPTDRRVRIAIAAVLVGVAIVVSGSLGTPTVTGDLLAFTAIIIFAITIVIWRRHPELDRSLTLAVSSLVLALVAAPLASLGDVTGRVLLAIGVMGAVTNPFGRLAYSTAPRFAPAAEVALFSPVETVAATIWVWIAFGESPSWTTIVGGIVIIAAVLGGTLTRHPATPGARRRPPSAR